MRWNNVKESSFVHIWTCYKRCRLNICLMSEAAQYLVSKQSRFAFQINGKEEVTMSERREQTKRNKWHIWQASYSRIWSDRWLPHDTEMIHRSNSLVSLLNWFALFTISSVTCKMMRANLLYGMFELMLEQWIELQLKVMSNSIRSLFTIVIIDSKPKQRINRMCWLI